MMIDTTAVEHDFWASILRLKTMGIMEFTDPLSLPYRDPVFTTGLQMGKKTRKA